MAVMDSDWQEVLIPPFQLLILGYRGRFTPFYLNLSGHRQKLPFSLRLTYHRLKIRQIQLSSPNLNQYTHIIATIAFDTHQELLWVGDDYVRFPTH